MWNRVVDSFRDLHWSSFHFLRAKALWLLVPVAILAILLPLSMTPSKKYREVVAPPLRAFVFTKNTPLTWLLPYLSLICTFVGCILALAGPSWQKKQIPAEKITTVSLVALDLSQSMLATDVQPSRLQRAKYKLQDWLDAGPHTPVGLVAFAGTAHPVLPFTLDYQLITHQAESLTPAIMPAPGTSITNLLFVIDSLMKNAKAPGNILLMTDVLGADDAGQLKNHMRTSPHHLYILLFSTPEGAPIPGHREIVSKQDPSALNELAADSAITIVPLTLDNSDVDMIAKKLAQNIVFEKKKKDKNTEWQDQGPLLLLPVLVLTLLAFRKGWTTAWCWPLIISLTLSSCGLRSRHPDWWYTRDYQGQLLSDNHQYKKSAARYEDDEHKAAALYKAGDYQDAADIFALVGTPASNYNRGLALIRLGRYQQADEALDSAAAQDPTLAIRVARVKKQLTVNDSSSITAARKTPEKKTSGDKDNPLKERKPQSDDEKLSSDTRVDKLPQTGSRVSDETQSNIHSAREAQFPPEHFKPEPSRENANEILLRQSTANPGEFLHRRFEIQQKRNPQKLNRSIPPW